MEEPNMLQPKDEPITIEFDALIEDPLKLPKSEQIKEEEDPNYKLVCVESSRLLETQDPQNGKSVSHHVQDESTIDHKDVLRNSIISQLMMQVKDEPPSSEFEATMEDQEIKVKIEQPIETIDDLSSNFPDTVSTESLDVPSLESIQAHDDTGAGSSTIIDNSQCPQQYKDGTPLFCTIWPKMKTEYKYEIYTREHIDEKPIIDKIFDSVPDDEGSLTYHSNSHVSQKCSLTHVCGKQVECSVTDLNKSSIMQLEKKIFSCHHCGNSFTRKNSLAPHMRLHSDQKLLACNVCDRIFHRKNLLMRHLKVHMGKNPSFCKLCNEKYIEKDHIENHFKLRSGEIPFSCDICRRKFGSKKSLALHLKSHAPWSLWCSVCGKNFKLAKDMRIHLRIHTGEKPYSCSVCGKRFNQKSPLRRHKMRHTKEYGFSCNICGRGFIRMIQLKNHLEQRRTRNFPPSKICNNVYVRERSYLCDICNGKFNLKHQLRQHIENHLSDWTFICNICSQRFKKKSSWAKHIQMKHTKMPNVDAAVTDDYKRELRIVLTRCQEAEIMSAKFSMKKEEND